jgi:hypothetical protein
MDKLTTLIKVLSIPHNFLTYLSLLTVLSLLALTGSVLFYELFKTRNKLKIIGGGMLTGALTFLLLISILTYAFKGTTALKIIFIAYCTGIVLRVYKKREEYKVLVKAKIGLIDALILSILVLYTLIFTLYAGNVAVGADSATYLGIAASIARGNYPTVLPWQPDYLTTYHHGAFMLEGAVHAIAGIDIEITHFAFAIYVISALFIYLTGIAREKTRSLTCLLPGIFMLVLFGPIFLYAEVSHYLTSLEKFFPLNSQHLKNNISGVTQFFEVKQSIGAGATNLGGFVYSTFIGFGTAVLVLFMDIILSKYRQNHLLIRHTILVTITMLSLSITVTFFLILIAIYPFVFIKECSGHAQKHRVKNALILGVLAFSLFFTLQNSIRDGLFVPKPEIARFKLLQNDKFQLNERIVFLQEREYLNPKSQTHWYVPNAVWYALVIFAGALLYKSKYAAFLAVASLISLFFSLTTVNTYWPSNGLRFTSKSYELATAGAGFFLVSLWVTKKRYTKLLALLLGLAFLPGLINAHLYLVQLAFADTYPNLTRRIAEKNETLEWITKNIPYTKRILFVDDYPTKATFSALTNEAIQYYGIFVPTAPSTYKVLNAEAAGEWYDATTQLSPYALKALKVDMVFITPEGEEHLSSSRQAQVEDQKYFKKIYSNTKGSLFEVKPSFKEITQDTDITLHSIIKQIPNNAKVYLGAIVQDEIRKEMILQLAKKTNLSGPPYSIAKDYFMYIETTLPFNTQAKDEKPIDREYAILQKDTLPQNILVGEYAKVLEHQYITLWKKKTQ